MVIIDCGSGETCQNDKAIVKEMIDQLINVDTSEHKIIFKWQLFTEVPAGCIPLAPDVFEYAYQYAKEKGYKTTASVFDKESLNRLLWYKVPFIKIACREYLYHFIDDIPAHISVMVSIKTVTKKYSIIENNKWRIIKLHCIPEYPANPTLYETGFGHNLSYSISDHTDDFYLFKKYQPLFYEKHYKLENSTGLDSGSFAKTPEEFKEIL